ncbi:MAG TPA: methyltransferase domain-containing protein [Alphaproteobacteria bacterium]|nr:methyltransferase domain-containing protein [Alphaproteobacteria bacterium]
MFGAALKRVRQEDPEDVDSGEDDMRPPVARIVPEPAPEPDDADAPAESRIQKLRRRVKEWWAGPCPGRHPFKVRLHAWWEGLILPPPPPAVEADDRRASDPVLSHSEGAGDDDEKNREQWTQERVDVLESVFGGGALTPGGIPAIMQLVKPLGLDPTMSVLEFGAGIGGATRAMAEEFGAWITGIESSPVLVEIARLRAQMSGMQKKAPVLQESLESPEVRARYYNAIYARDVLYTVGKKDALLAILVQALRPRGQLTFIDYVAADDLALVSTEINDWKAREPVPVSLWTAERYRQALTVQKLDVRTIEDLSDEVMRDILAAWGNYLKTLDIKGFGVSSTNAGILMKEAELWVSRYNALHSGRLRAMRVYAMKK